MVPVMSFQEKIDNLSVVLKSRNIGLILKTIMADFAVDLKKLETLSALSDDQALQFIQTISPMLDFKVANRSVFNTCVMLGYEQCAEYIIPRTNEDGIAEAQSFALAFDQPKMFERLWKEKSNLEFNDQAVLKKLVDKGRTGEFFQGLNKMQIEPKKLAAYFHRAMMSNRADIYEPLYDALTKIGVADFNPLIGAARFQRLDVFKKYMHSKYVESEKVFEVIKENVQFLDAAYEYLSNDQKINVLPYMIKNNWLERTEDVLNTLVPSYRAKERQAPTVNIQNILHRSFTQALKNHNTTLATKIFPSITNRKQVANDAFEHAARKKAQDLVDFLLPHTTQAGRNSALIKLAVENKGEAAQIVMETANLTQVEKQLYNNLELQYKDVKGLIEHSKFNETIAAVFNKIQRHTLQKNIKSKTTVEPKKKLI